MYEGVHKPDLKDVLPEAEEKKAKGNGQEPISEEPISNEIVKLVEMGPIEYDKSRKLVADQLGVSVGAVDKEVKLAQRAKTDAESQLLFPEITACTDTVEGASLLADITAEIRRYIVLPEHAAIASALWILHTYVIKAAYISPILAIQSPQKRCGKSQLLTILNALANRGLMVANLSLAALYRAMDKYRPTLLIDEADAFLDEAEEMRGIINAGHSRATARKLRVGGENKNELEIFDSFGPKAIAGIGKRQDTIADRSIIIPLRRRLKGEVVEVLRQDRLDYRDIKERCAGWASQNLDELLKSDPDMPELHDRAQTNWRPLIAIANLCGWEDKARNAAIALTESDSDETAAVMVLEDIKNLFTKLNVKKLSSADIVDALHKMEERPWPEWKLGKPITQRQLARLLAPFDIKPKVIDFAGDKKRGYEIERLTDAFSRYIPVSDPQQRNKSHNHAGCDGFLSVTSTEQVTDRSVTSTSNVTDEKALKASDSAKCYGVTDRTRKITEDCDVTHI